MEMEIYHGVREWLGFALNWVDRPEVPLDAEGAEYQAGLFVRYVVQRTGDRAFPTRLWTPPAEGSILGSGKPFPEDLPLQALQRVFAARGEVFCSADPSETDVFASGYCMDAYFLSDRSSRCFLPEVHERYGNRAVTQIADLRPGDLLEIPNQ
jgi:hypothetical protein